MIIITILKEIIKLILQFLLSIAKIEVTTENLQNYHTKKIMEDQLQIK